jgi:hypothetical protein
MATKKIAITEFARNHRKSMGKVLITDCTISLFLYKGARIKYMDILLRKTVAPVRRATVLFYKLLRQFFAVNHDIFSDIQALPFSHTMVRHCSPTAAKFACLPCPTQAGEEILVNDGCIAQC